ncbi:MAG: hypothetical protein AB8B95_16280, partial [Pseudohongiellaceae bacterium]
MSDIRQHSKKILHSNGKEFNYYSLNALAEQGYQSAEHLPVSIKILLENLLRHCDGKVVNSQHISDLTNWTETQHQGKEILFHPVRVLMQDFTGV